MRKMSIQVPTINNATNDPIDFNIGKTIYKVQKISYNQIFRILEPKIIQEYKDNIKEFASIFEGKERINYVTQEMRKIPSGEELINKIIEKMQTTEGLKTIIYLALKNHNKITMNDIEDIFALDGVDEDISMIINYVLQNKETKEEIKPETKSEDNVEKSSENPL